MEKAGVFHDQYGMSAKQIETALKAMADGTALEGNAQSAKIESYILDKIANRHRTYTTVAEDTTSTPQQPQQATEERTPQQPRQEQPTTPEQRLNAIVEETLHLSPVAQDQIQSVDTQAAENYNENRRSQTVQDAIDRLNAGGDSSPDINEILSIPEIAEAERANEGTPTIDLPNREKIREDGYRQAMQKGSWNGTERTIPAKSIIISAWISSLVCPEVANLPCTQNGYLRNIRAGLLIQMTSVNTSLSIMVAMLLLCMKNLPQLEAWFLSQRLKMAITSYCLQLAQMLEN